MLSGTCWDILLVLTVSGSLWVDVFLNVRHRFDDPCLRVFGIFQKWTLELIFFGRISTNVPVGMLDVGSQEWTVI